uniref:Acetyl-coenzyme A carboxylase carboxyl transferase subunit beta n=1 Tax=Epipogium roseum TaxID=556037 RepID=A0A0B4N4W4_9ASPA|nr:acetyl-CoA carboxylase carboxyltransferase beta subunit [Epipogium roseum]AII40856.1 acetyl-CoA carboxylase carboxyltransferase beta subunit [Epipogium roseum]
MKKYHHNFLLYKKNVKHRYEFFKYKKYKYMDSIYNHKYNDNTSYNFNIGITSSKTHNLKKKEYIKLLFESINIWSLLSDKMFLIKNILSDNIFNFYFDITNQIFDIDSSFYFFSELEIIFFNYFNSEYIHSIFEHYFYIIKNYNNIYNYINYLLNSYILCLLNINNITDIYVENYIYDFICTDIISNIEVKSYNLSLFIDIKTVEGYFHKKFNYESEYNIDEESFIDYDIFNITKKYKHLWVQCENCYGLNYKNFLKEKLHICEYCGYHFKMSSSDRIDLFVDADTWNPLFEDIISVDPIEFNSNEDPYLDKILFYQDKTNLNEAIQTGIGKLNGINIAIGIMDFNFMGGSMGSVVGENITRLIEYASNKSIPVIIMCASGGARMQEGSFSLAQMSKISSALYDYQLKKKLFYISILTSPTTGGVTASFGMLGDIIISEPNAYIAFAGKRVIEQTLNKEVPEGIQEAEFLFNQGLFDIIVPRNILKKVLSDLLKLHGFYPCN